MIFFFYVKFAFFGVIIKTPSSGQNCHEVNQSWTLPIAKIPLRMLKNIAQLLNFLGTISPNLFFLKIIPCPKSNSHFLFCVGAEENGVSIFEYSNLNTIEGQNKH